MKSEGTSTYKIEYHQDKRLSATSYCCYWDHIKIINVLDNNWYVLLNSKALNKINTWYDYLLEFISYIDFRLTQDKHVRNRNKNLEIWEDFIFNKK